MVIVKLAIGLVSFLLPHMQNATSPTTVSPTTVSFSSLPPVWQCIAHYESTDNIHAVNPTTNDQGAFQFNLATWAEFAPSTYPRHPVNATLSQQYTVALNLWTAQGFSPWETAPLCVHTPS